MNPYMKMQLDSARNAIEAMKASIEIAAKMDDGTIDRKERAQIEKIVKASNRFLRETEGIE